MRTCLIVLLLLCGCSQTMYLYQRGAGGPPVQGELSTTASTMTVPLDGETYTGRFKRGTSMGIGVGFSGNSAATGISSSMSNNYSGLLVSPSHKTLRCEFVGGLGESGNGVCQHGDGRMFDLLLKP